MIFFLCAFSKIRIFWQTEGITCFRSKEARRSPSIGGERWSLGSPSDAASSSHRLVAGSLFDLEFFFTSRMASISPNVCFYYPVQLTYSQVDREYIFIFVELKNTFAWLQTFRWINSLHSVANLLNFKPLIFYIKMFKTQLIVRKISECMHKGRQKGMQL